MEYELVDESQFLQLGSVSCLGILQVGAELMGMLCDECGQLGGDRLMILDDGGDGYVFEYVVVWLEVGEQFTHVAVF